MAISPPRTAPEAGFPAGGAGPRRARAPDRSHARSGAGCRRRMDAQRDALARAGFAHEPQHLAGPDLEIDAVDGVGQRRGAVRNVTCRSSTRSRALDGGHHRFTSRRSARPSPSRLKPRPAQHDGEARERPRSTRPCVMKFLPSAISTPHSAVWRLRAEAEVAEAGAEQDRQRHVGHPVDEHGRDGVGQQMWRKRMRGRCSPCTRPPSA